ncbi:hypothetical protein OZK63_40955, partial [Streptomyces sp. UMAF16]|nr:hypothetical protein [Streptomyces sp. UMAF16]
ALMPEARNRLNTIFMSLSFVGTTLGSAMGLLLWKWALWPGAIAGSVSLIILGWIIFLLTGKK